jgi:hypothetical protein
MKEEKKLRIEKDAFTLRAAFLSLIYNKQTQFNCLAPTDTGTSTWPSEVLL